MELKELKPRIALNKAYLKLKTNRSDIEHFKENLILLLNRTNDKESEEFHKNLISDFLKKTFFEPKHFINTKGRNDLVIHNGTDAKSSVGVIIEAKKPTNKSEMLTKSKINVKAFQELVLYFLRERITHKNLEIKHLIATNINEWYIFDANFFEKIFAQNKDFVKQFTDFENGTLTGKTTDFFYKEIAEPFITTIKQEIEFTYFDIRDYDKALRNNDKTDDNKLIALFKLTSPEHILKLPFANDSNSLDKRFYAELLHIIGLVETKEGGKKIIQRLQEKEQNTGSLLENAIIQLDSLDKINQLNNPSHFGDTQEERLFNVGLELVITWINRILFLKLLEAQLITYHKGDRSYSFLNIEKLHDYDDLNALFFQVLAKRYDERNKDVKQTFEKVPYLNSSLFEPTSLEQLTLFINGLADDKALPIYSSTILKDENGKKKTGKISALTYLYDFLNAYDFSSEGSEEIQEDNKTLINASVLGLIFEKINGYKDGSFFTPGFITMYMCRETIRRAVVQKFNETKNWNIENFDNLYDKIEDRTEANKIINSIKICDPAVGSGHFLVSALNEVLAIKNDLKILQDRTGKRLKEYQIEVVNDELIITDEEGELYEYNPKNKESQRIQETLFHEKQTIIENCLFGVDINQNSVKICRLRLWIELLKSAYYKNETELETLPNIDINIKCGNSLISRFGLDADLSTALKKSKWNIQSYRLSVDTYRNAENKEQKREMERLISDIKNDFQIEIYQNDPKVVKLKKMEYEHALKYEQNMFKEDQSLYGNKSNKKKAKELEIASLTAIEKIKNEIEEIKNNKIYENAFEWRFEFPDVLDDKGNFVGFDAIIGNPPYIQLQSIKEISNQIKQFEYKTYDKTGDIYSLFYEKGYFILKENGFLGFITSNKWMRAGYGRNTRNFILNHTQPLLLVDLGGGVFEEATVDSNLLLFQKSIYTKPFKSLNLINEKSISNINKFNENILTIQPEIDENWMISSSIEKSIKQKIGKIGKPLKDWNVKIFRGVLTGYNEAFIIDKATKEILIAEDPNSSDFIKPILRGRDIKCYKAEFSDLWLINIPKGFTIKSKKNEENKNINIVEEPSPRYGYYEIDEAWLWFEKKLPAIAAYLKPFKLKAKNRTDMGDYWWELRACSYLNEFEKEKIVYPETTHKASFHYDINNFYLDKTAFFLVSPNSKYLLSIFNSKLFEWSYKNLYSSVKLGENGFQFNKHAFENYPIPDINQLKLIELVDKILALKKENPKTDTKDLENEIDKLVYKLYELTEEEIKVIEESVK